VVKDKEAAAECISENAILRKIAHKCVEVTGGLFVRLPGDSRRYRDSFLKNCEEVGISTEILSASRALDLVPELNPAIEEAIAVPDCSIDLSGYACSTPTPRGTGGGGILIHHKVLDIVREKGRCVGVKVEDLFSSQIKEIRAKIIINASGAWWGHHSPHGRERGANDPVQGQASSSPTTGSPTW
jgi:glycerol-3-phosphate dehydrogenase